ncbi:MAG: PVC-type heme-binding CxxCH protein [Phycisphaeraceae bacterium]
MFELPCRVQVCRLCSLALKCGCFSVVVVAMLLPSTSAAEKDFAGELPRIEPLEPDAALRAFEVADGYRVELVAAEPLVTDPVAMAFDEDGRLYVAEMGGYSEERDEAIGRIRILEDTNGDGRMDQAHTFAEGLRWPTAIFAWDGGIFVGAAPDLLYIADTTGDGKADHREVVFSGMAPADLSQLNVQQLVNSLRWGLDNRIHGTPTRGTQIHPVDNPDAAISMRGREFNFDPHTRELGFSSGGNQWGASFDAWGRLFTCVNHIHNQMVMFENRYVARNPHLQTPSPLLTIGDGGQRADLLRISPPEPWRVVRTRLRTTGQLSGPVERDGELHGYVSAASAITIYQGDAYEQQMSGAAVIAAPDNNLVHRERLEPDGVAMRGVRIDEDTEWLRTADNWFRPVWITHAPDGTLWVADMYREVIEHPWSLPDSIKRHLDLTAGRDRGRIYRIVPDDFEPRAVPALSEASTEELVNLLEHPNHWHRLTAARLLHERQDVEAIVLLNDLLAQSDQPLGRLHALYALQGLGALELEHVRLGLGDEHGPVRENAIRLAEAMLTESEELLSDLLALASDDDMRVRYQLAFTLGESNDPARHDALTTLLKSDGDDRWMRMAVFSSLADVQADILTGLVGDAEFTKASAGRAVLEELARQVGAAGEAEKVDRSLDALSDADSEGAHRAVLLGLARGMGLAQLRRALADDPQLLASLDRLFEDAHVLVTDADASTHDRIEAIETFGLLSFDATAEDLASLLAPREPIEVQAAALQMLARHRDAAVADLLIERWGGLGSSVRASAMDALLARPERRTRLIEAIENGNFSATHVTLPNAIRLRNDPNADLAARAGAVLTDAAESSDRRELIDIYLQEMTDLQGDADRGRIVFAAACATCHAVDGTGDDLGPNLRAFVTRGQDAIVAAVLNPNAQVDPQFSIYIVETEDDETFMGVMTAESANSITLSPGGGVEQQIPRSNIKTIQTSGNSLMPEGLEGAIDPQQMADLIKFLEDAQ